MLLQINQLTRLCHSRMIPKRRGRRFSLRAHTNEGNSGGLHGGHTFSTQHLLRINLYLRPTSHPPAPDNKAVLIHAGLRHFVHALEHLAAPDRSKTCYRIILRMPRSCGSNSQGGFAAKAAHFRHNFLCVLLSFLCKRPLEAERLQ